MEWLIVQLECCSQAQPEPRRRCSYLSDIGVRSLALIVRASLGTQVCQVNYTVSALESILRRQKRSCSSTTQRYDVRTQHVSTLILNAALVTNVRRDTEIHDEVCLTRVLLRIQAADEEEANATGELLGQGLQLIAQGWKREQLLRDGFKGEVEA